MIEVYLAGTSRERGQRGFTLVELMIVVAILALLATIGLPPLTDAMQSAKMTATAESMDQVGRAWVAKGGTGGESDFFVGGTALDLSIYSQPVTASQLEQYLQMEVPELDAWGSPMEYKVDALPSRCLLIRSRNADKQFDPGNYVVGTSIPKTERFRDLVWADRRWIVRPGPFPGIVVPLPPAPTANF